MSVRKWSRSWRGAVVLMSGIAGVATVSCYAMTCCGNDAAVLLAAAGGAVAAIVTLSAGYCGFSIGKTTKTD